MFLAVPLAGSTGEPVMGNKEDLGKQVNLIDQMYQYTKYPKPDANTPSTILAVDESCGIRLVKFPIPDDADKTLTWNADFPGNPPCRSLLYACGVPPTCRTTQRGCRTDKQGAIEIF